jgi:hypothetical protein
MDDEVTEDQFRWMRHSAPLLLEMHEGWHEAMKRYHRTPPELIAEHDDTTAANNIRSHMWSEVVRRFDGRSGFSLLRLGRLNLLNYRDESVWRFKKVDGNGRHRNYQTKQQQDYDDQLDIPGIPAAAVRLTSGYYPDAAGSAVERVIISRPFGPSIMWAAQINIESGIAASWSDITPLRLAGTGRFDYRGRRSGGKT